MRIKRRENTNGNDLSRACGYPYYIWHADHSKRGTRTATSYFGHADTSGMRILSLLCPYLGYADTLTTYLGCANPEAFISLRLTSGMRILPLHQPDNRQQSSNQSSTLRIENQISVCLVSLAVEKTKTKTKSHAEEKTMCHRRWYRVWSGN